MKMVADAQSDLLPETAASENARQRFNLLKKKGKHMSETEDINKKIWELWTNHPQKAGARVPKFAVPPRKTDTLLFLGLNPSFPNLKERDKERIENKTALNYPRDFEWKTSPLAKAFNRDIVNKHASVHDADARENYGWFRRLNCLAHYLGVKINDYGHIDLYLWMDANFHEIQKRLNDSTYKDFIEQQNNLVVRLLAIHKPRMIISVYPRAANKLLELGFDVVEQFTPVANLPLKRAVIRLPTKIEVQVFRPTKAIPTGKWCMSNLDFDQMLDYFKRLKV
jgi:hypothetical protein